jgi:hypothetical protein
MTKVLLHSDIDEPESFYFIERAHILEIEFAPHPIDNLFKLLLISLIEFIIQMVLQALHNFDFAHLRR